MANNERGSELWTPGRGVDRPTAVRARTVDAVSTRSLVALLAIILALVVGDLADVLDPDTPPPESIEAIGDDDLEQSPTQGPEIVASQQAGALHDLADPYHQELVAIIDDARGIRTEDSNQTELDDQCGRHADLFQEASTLVSQLEIEDQSLKGLMADYFDTALSVANECADTWSELAQRYGDALEGRWGVVSLSVARAKAGIDVAG